MTKKNCQLISYIAPSAPATRRAATGEEPFLRPEIGFTPKWYFQRCGINFGKVWHTDPVYRKKTVLKMRSELKKSFPNSGIGGIDAPAGHIDLLSGTFGACTIAGIYGIPIRYQMDQWPACEHQYLSNEELDDLQPPDLDNNEFFQQLISQLDWIADNQGRIEGFINWQGILNNAQRLRGSQLFLDLYENPDRALHLFNCVCTTMIKAAKKIFARQKQSGVKIGFFTVSNCLVNMLSSDMYQKFLLPYDTELSNRFGCIGVHNCAWNANPFLDAYARIPNIGYIDMGLDSDLKKARELFPKARRAVMYTPMDIANKTIRMIQMDLEKIADNYGPCDIVAADIEFGTPDAKILDFIQLCLNISRRKDQI